jgi:hypothetical protein
MARRKKEAKKPSRDPDLRVEIDAVTLWEPMPQAPSDSVRARPAASGLAIQSWGFRPPARADGGEAPLLEILIYEAAYEQALPDEGLKITTPARDWSVQGRYVETREFRGPDGAPRPKHFFEAKVPRDLEERLRESPEDIMARSDLYGVELLDES